MNALLIAHVGGGLVAILAGAGDLVVQSGSVEAKGRDSLR
jgi:hypothetical protein